MKLSIQHCYLEKKRKKKDKEHCKACSEKKYNGCQFYYVLQYPVEHGNINTFNTGEHHPHYKETINFCVPTASSTQRYMNSLETFIN